MRDLITVARLVFDSFVTSVVLAVGVVIVVDALISLDRWMAALSGTFLFLSFFALMMWGRGESDVW